MIIFVIFYIFLILLLFKFCCRLFTFQHLLIKYFHIVVRTSFVRSGMFYKEILQPLCHTHCVMLKIFQLDFNNPAVNTFFTATKIISHSRCNNGCYIGKLFCGFIFINLALPPFGQIPATHPLCVTRNLFYFFASISNISLSCVHHLNTREYFYVKILSTSRVQHLNSSKKIQSLFYLHKLTNS